MNTTRKATLLAVLQATTVTNYVPCWSGFQHSTTRFQSQVLATTRPFNTHIRTQTIKCILFFDFSLCSLNFKQKLRWGCRFSSYIGLKSVKLLRKLMIFIQAPRRMNTLFYYANFKPILSFLRQVWPREPLSKVDM